jgi:hypothetical protein
VKNSKNSPQRRKDAKAAKKMKAKLLKNRGFSSRIFAPLRLCGEGFGLFSAPEPSA